MHWQLQMHVCMEKGVIAKANRYPFGPSSLTIALVATLFILIAWTI
jgi:hypothetical protein